ncbi:hypothetical protein HHA04nite_15540 [Halomonas halophila]|uniref:Uncharacterized protein n=1 Tax=Halomonas halophila TaxID=29573 RepID=A0ABQ0U3I2_9GAMM|nr:hypothetical protein HHA04nite_15540 [Halomonas halophila]
MALAPGQGAAMHQQPGGLVHGDQMLVVMEDGQRFVHRATRGMRRGRPLSPRDGRMSSVALCSGEAEYGKLG